MILPKNMSRIGKKDLYGVFVFREAKTSRPLDRQIIISYNKTNDY